MAYIIRSTSETFDTAAATATPVMIEHETNDLILMCITQDGGGTAITTATSGWAMIGTGAASGGSRQQWAYKVAASGSEPAPTFSGATDEWIISTFIVKDADTTTPIHLNARSDWNNPAGGTIASPSMTTTNNDCLLFYSWGTDGISDIITPPSDMQCVERQAGTTALHIAGWRNLRTAGSAPSITALHESSVEGGNAWIIAVNNTSGGSLSPEVRPSCETIRYYGQGNWGGTFSALSTLAATINGKTASATAYTVNTGGLIAECPWGNSSQLTSSSSVTPAYEGSVDTFTAQDLSDALITMVINVSTVSAARFGPDGLLVAFADSTGNYIVYQLATRIQLRTRTYTIAIKLGEGTIFASSGSIDLTDINRMAIFTERTASTNLPSTINIKFLMKQAGATLIGGTTDLPATNEYIYNNLVSSWGIFGASSFQGSGQLLSNQTLQIGDGSTPTVTSFAANSFELPKVRTNVSTPIAGSNFAPGDNTVDYIIRASASDTISLASAIVACANSQNFTIHSSSSASATYDFTGCSIVGYVVTNNVVGITFNGATFNGTRGITLNGGSMDACVVTESLTTPAVTTDNPGRISNSRFTSAGTGHAIEMTAIGTFDFEGNSFTGYGAGGTTDAAIYNNSGGLITLNLAQGDTAPTVRNGAGASTTINAFVQESGLSFSNLIAGSQVVIYEMGTTTELFRTNSSATTEEYTEVTSLLEVDYTIQKAGYVPIRVAGLSLTSVQAVPVAQVEDRAYVASSGLSYGTTATVNTGTERFGLTTASTLQNYYSFMIESWIAQSALRNITFPIIPNGPNSYTLSDGWEFTSSTDIDFLSRDGLRYTSAGVATAVYSAILSLGTATGFQGEYQQTSGGTAVNAKATGAFDQLIQVYGDASHGNFDYRAYLRLKYQVNGYRESYVDVVNLYGNVSDELYIVSMEPQVIPDFTTGNPGITGVTITDHGATPVSWNAGNGAKDYSITIEDGGTNSAEDILEWVNYNLSLDATFQGKEPFNWPEMVLKNGDDFETLRGIVIGGVGAALKGVRVIRTGGTPHPDFARFQADDGTYGLPPVFQQVVLSGGVANSRIQLYDLTSSTELANEIVASFPYTWTDSAGYVADREIRLRVSYQATTDAKLFIDQVIGTSTSTSPIVSFLISQEDDEVYIANAIDGSTITTITIDDGALLVEVDSGSITWPQIYAYETYWLDTEDGIRDEGRFILARDTANYILYDFKIKNVTSPSVPLTITGGWGRDSVTGLTETIIDTTGGTVFSNPDLVISYAVGSGVTPADIVAIADAVWDETASGHTTAGSTGKELTDAKSKAALAAALSA